jgi:hypothetical protein
VRCTHAVHDNNGEDVDCGTWSVAADGIGEGGLFGTNHLGCVGKVVVRAILQFPYLNIFYRGVSAATVRVTDVSGFEESEIVGFVRGGRDANDLMGLSSAVMVSQRPPFWRSRRERSSCSALVCRSCLRPHMVGQLPAMWPLLVNWPHMGQRKVGLWVRRRVLCTPHMNYCLWVNCMLVSAGRPPAAQRRRPRRGCCRPVGTYLYLHAVGAGNPIAVPGMAR